MQNKVESIALEKLVAHPENPNRMSRGNFLKLVRNIKRSGLYEPLIVRGNPKKTGFFEIINGHHRCEALKELGYKEADCAVWDVDDHEVDILLVTLNRLGGIDRVDKKLALLKRLNKKAPAAELAKLLPGTARQIERLSNLKRPAEPVKVRADAFATSLVFFVNNDQKAIIEEALKKVQDEIGKRPRAVKKAMAVTVISEHFLKRSEAMARMAGVFVEDMKSGYETNSGDK